MGDRKKVPHDIQVKVLIEAGYRCAVPTCRNILAIDLHHLVEVADGGGNEPENLIALCPMCHALFHRGKIEREAVYAWKSILVALGQAFDLDAIDLLLFLEKTPPGQFACDGSGVLRFARLVAADLAYFKLIIQNGPLLLYSVGLTLKGSAFVKAWIDGNRAAFQQAQGGADLISE